MSNIHNRLEIQKHAVRELDENRAANLERHFKECADCRAFYESLLQENSEFLEEHPFSSIYVPEKERGKSWFEGLVDSFKPVLIPVSVALLAIAVIMPFTGMFYKNKPTDITYKGGESLLFIYKRDGAVSPGSSDILFKANDQLQIIYNSDKEQYISLMSVDSKGTVSFYHPDQSSPYCSVHSGKGSSLYFPGSIVLDSTKGVELIIAVFSSEPLKTISVERTITYQFGRSKDIQVLKSSIDQGKILNNNKTATLLINKG